MVYILETKHDFYEEVVDYFVGRFLNTYPQLL